MGGDPHSCLKGSGGVDIGTITGGIYREYIGIIIGI